MKGLDLRVLSPSEGKECFPVVPLKMSQGQMSVAQNDFGCRRVFVAVFPSRQLCKDTEERAGPAVGPVDVFNCTKSFIADAPTELGRRLKKHGREREMRRGRRKEKRDEEGVARGEERESHRGTEGKLPMSCS